MLDYSKWRKIKIINGIACSLQHGDIKPDNIIWNGNSFFFIDIDNIHYYPLFFDLLHFIAATTNNKIEAVNYLKTIKSKIESSLKNIKIKLDANIINYIINNYIDYYGGDKNCVEDYIYLLD